MYYKKYFCYLVLLLFAACSKPSEPVFDNPVENETNNPNNNNDDDDDNSPLTLCEALDNCNLTFNTDGSSVWTAQTNESNDGQHAAESGAITHNQETWLETSIQGPGTLQYWWKADSENGYDFLQLQINEILVGETTGDFGWHDRAYLLREGNNTVRWTYLKDGSESGGADKGWVDQVTVTNETCGAFLFDEDGNRYETVQIGDQCWMAENLNTEEGRWSYYNNDESNGDTFGKLYGYNTATNICPTGWDLPTESEWRELVDFLGGESVAGGKLKSTEFWNAPNEGATNESGFNALPGGLANGDGFDFDSAVNYFGILEAGAWWSSTQINLESEWYDFRLSYDSEGVSFGAALPGDQRSIRCILE